MSDVIEYYNDESLNIATEIINSKQYFNENILTTKKILEIMYKYNNEYRLEKYLIVNIIKILLIIICEGIKKGLTIKIPVFAEYSLFEYNQKKCISFLPHKEFLNDKVIDNLSFFKIKRFNNINYNIEIIDNSNKHSFIYKYKKRLKKKKIKINYKDIILSDNDNINYKNKKITLMIISDLINDKLKNIRYDKSRIPKVYKYSNYLTVILRMKPKLSRFFLL